LLAATLFSCAVGDIDGAVRLTSPWLPFTENADVPPDSVQAPPVFAVPQLPVADRVKVSAATVLLVLDTVMLLVAEPVAPWLSVTVSFTVYVPDDA